MNMGYSTLIDPTTLPSVPLGERKALPDTAAIYVVMAGDTASMPSKGKT